jgi:spore maturation protein CgeB
VDKTERERKNVRESATSPLASESLMPLISSLEDNDSDKSGFKILFLYPFGIWIYKLNAASNDFYTKFMQIRLPLCSDWISLLEKHFLDGAAVVLISF